MSSKKKSNQNIQKNKTGKIVKRDNRGKFISKNNTETNIAEKKKYTMEDFYNDINSSEPNNVKATVKGITFGLKGFVKGFSDNSPHPMTKFVKDTMKEIFS